VQQDLSVQLDQKVHRENRAVEVLLVLKELQEHPVVLDQLDPLVTKDDKERLVHPEPEEQQELQEAVDLRDQLVNLANPDKLVPKVTPDQEVQREKPDTKEQQVHEDVMDPKDSSVQLDQLEALEPQDE